MLHDKISDSVFRKLPITAKLYAIQICALVTQIIQNRIDITLNQFSIMAFPILTQHPMNWRVHIRVCMQTFLSESSVMEKSETNMRK